MRNYTDISVSEHLSSQIIFSDARVVQSLEKGLFSQGPNHEGSDLGKITLSQFDNYGY
jgi:hypothetical protein